MKKYIVFSLLAALFFSLDIATKKIIEKEVPYLSEIKITEFLNIVHVRNRGSIFGIFSDVQDKTFRFFLNALSILALLFLFLFARTLEGFPFYITGAMFGGALGNIFERITKGYVVDFIDLHIGKHHWPAFNVADSIITIGMLVIVLHSIGIKRT